MDTFLPIGFTTILAGSACLYLASPNQRLLTKPLPAWRARRMGALLLAVSMLAFLKSMQAIAATFVFATTLMLMFIAFPYIGALVSAYKGN